MSRWSGILAVAVAAVATLVCALPAPALADATENTSMLDDNQLIYVSPSHMSHTLQQMASLGVDTVKVSLVWSLVAPSASSHHRPKFDASNPAAYPQGAWDRWDTLVTTAHQLGMKVYFLVIGPAPLWAVPNSSRNGQGPNLGWAPNPHDYQNFVEAAGRRYSGAYTIGGGGAGASSASSGPSLPVQTVTVPTVPETQPPTPTVTQSTPEPPAAAGKVIPRVGIWGIWNEPNERSWMNPWYKKKPGGGLVYIQPQEYRGLVDAAWNALSASSHSSDTILIGETANRGILTPGQFIRGLYCVGGNLRPLSGSDASQIGCPTSGPPSKFANQHPGLFQPATWAHHPYGFDIPPNRQYPDHTWITLYNLGSLERLLSGIYVTYGLHPAGGVGLYLTEWGEKSNPPNPYVKTTTTEQAAWINQGEYMTWRLSYVHALNQFLLVDSPPKAGEPKGSFLYWSTFQTGLETMKGSPKPAYQAFRVPIWLPSPHHGKRVAVWGQLRPANHSVPQAGVIEFRAHGSGKWSELTQVQTSSPEGFIYNHVSIPSAGDVRLGWLDPGGAVVYSRNVAVS